MSMAPLICILGIAIPIAGNNGSSPCRYLELFEHFSGKTPLLFPFFLNLLKCHSFGGNTFNIISKLGKILISLSALDAKNFFAVTEVISHNSHEIEQMYFFLAAILHVIIIETEKSGRQAGIMVTIILYSRQ